MYQTVNKCKLRGEFSVTSEEDLCSQKNRLRDYDFDRYAAFTVMAIYATGIGLHKFQQENCPGQNLSSCLSEVRNQEDDRMMDKLKNAVSRVQLWDNDDFTGSQKFNPFDLDGNGNFNYIVRLLKPKELSSKTYEVVPVYKTESFRSEITNIKAIEPVNFYDGQPGDYKPIYQPIEYRCTSCPCSVDPPPPPPPPSPTMIAMYAIVGLLSAVILVAVIVLVYKRYRKFFLRKVFHISTSENYYNYSSMCI